MKVRLLICSIALMATSLGGIAVAQQPAVRPSAGAVVPPAVDEESVAAVTPLVKQRNDLQSQINAVNAQIRIVQSAALAKAKLDSLYWGLAFDGTHFQQLRQLPQN